MSITLLPVQSEAEKRAFYHFAFRVYKDDSNYEEERKMNKKKLLQRVRALLIFFALALLDSGLTQNHDKFSQT